MKKIIRGVVVAAVAIAALSIAAPPAAAAGSAVDLTSASQMMSPAGGDLAVFAVDLTGSSLVTMSGVHVDFAQVGADTDFDIGDLEASPDGVAFWRDSSTATAQTQDVWDGGDQKLSDSFAFSGLRATLDISPAVHLPQSDPAEGDYTYFVTVRLSAGVSDGDDFTVTLPSDAFQTSIPIFGFVAATTHTVTADPDAPAVQVFSPAVTQTDNVLWKLTETVTGVGASTVAFRVRGTGTAVPATVSWIAASNTIVLDPASPLTAGQHYDAVLLPNGPGAIVDRAGNELEQDVRTFRAATDVAETAAGTTYRWRSITTSKAYGGSYTINNMAGAVASWAFTGSSVTWYTLTDPYQGKAAVSIDGVAKATVNNYTSSTKFLVARTFTGLSSGAHTITIRVLGTRGSSAGRDTRIMIDAFKAGGVLFKTPNAVFTWSKITTSGAAGGQYLVARFGGSEMTFSFRGTRVDWRTALSPSMGKATVYIDGISKGTFDNYSGVTVMKFFRSFAGLSDAVHTIRIVVSSSMNEASKGTIIGVDGFVVA